jgi:spore coat protein A, manganese oxidase
MDARLDQGAALGEQLPEPARKARRFGRRAFLGILGGGALALLVPVRVRPGRFLPIPEGAAPALAAQRFRRKLPIPRTLRGADLRIPIRLAGVRILPGRKTKMWTYGGTFPGPTIRRRAGEETRVTFVHKLPKKAGELTVHLHGGHNRSEFDGQPGGLTALHRFSLYCRIPAGLTERQSGNGLLLRPGGSKTYVYDLIEDGGPERAAFQWYHDHRLDHTGRNVWKGLAGMWIIEDELEDSLDLPAGDRDIPLLIADRSLDRHNQLTNPFTNLKPPDDGVSGALVLVNGAHRPHHPVSARRYRLRILNASNFRSYNLALSNGARMVQVATDSGFMPRPVKRRRLLLGPAERAEVIVDFSGAAGHAVVLESVKRHDGERSLGSRPHLGPLMQFRVGARRKDTTRIPRKLRPLPAWTREARRAPDRHWVISLGGAFFPAWLINGKTFDPARADAHPVIGTTETWQITNKTKVTHIVHMHHTDWYMLARNGKPPKPWEDCLKETFFVEPGDTIRVAGHFSDFTGKYAIHCHMLDHEDHGLMTQFEVVEAAGQPAGDEVARRRRGEIPAHPAPETLGLPDRLPPGAAAVEFTPVAPAGEPLDRIELAVNGEDRLSLDGSARPVELPLAAGPLTRVTAVAHTADGRLLSATRDYPTGV